jgi:hypothetical protein
MTTGKGWCFLRRIDGTLEMTRMYGLEMTRMYGDFFALEGFSVGAQAEGFHLPDGMTILKALYFFTHLAETAPIAPFISTCGVPGQIDVPPPFDLPDPGPRNRQDSEELEIIGGYEAARSHQYYQGAIYQSLQFEPWVPENLLGRKTWLGKTLPDGNPVVLKLWDAWKETDIDQVQEAKIYLKLKPLWGIYVPALLVQSPLEFYHALLVQHVKVFPLPRPV